MARIPVDSFIDHLQLNPQHFFCFVNDGSTDGTEMLLESIASTCTNAMMLSLQNNSGKAEAVRKGILIINHQVSVKYIGYLDADLATPLSFISVMEKEMNRGEVDLIFGSRQLAKKNAVERKTFRHYSGRFVSIMINRALGKKFGDTQCGAKLINASIVNKICSEPFLSTWLFDVEIIKRCLVKGFTNIKEIPVTQWKDVGNSKVSKWYFFKMFGELSRIKKIH